MVSPASLRSCRSSCPSPIRLAVGCGFAVIARLVQPLLRWFIPARVRDATYTTPDHDATATARPSEDHQSVLRGENVALVRPYVVAHEQYQERELQRHRRRTLRLALHGFDVGAEWIHGVRVSAS